MAKRYWLAHLIEVDSDQEAQALLSEQRASLGDKALDSECRPCIVSEDADDVSQLFRIPAEDPELAAAANFEIELPDDECA